MYVALGVGIVVALNALIVVAARFVAQRAHADPSVEELDAELRALLLSACSSAARSRRRRR